MADVVRAQRHKRFGVEQRLAGDVLSGSLTWFHRRTRNQIDFTPCRDDIAICADGARPFGTYDNIARARASGVEAAVDLRPSARLRINAAYTWLDAENRTPGNPDFGKTLLRRPKSSLALNADWRAPLGLSLGGTLRQVTEDHSVVAELVRRGSITREEAETHPHRNVITRALGAEEGVDADVVHVDLEDGDVVLLCSDGLSSYVPEAAIAEVLAQAERLDEAARGLVNLANGAGGADNVTVVLVRRH